MKVLGGILLGVGLLVAGLSGLCSLSMIIEEMHGSNGDITGTLVLVGIVGGIPFLMGLGMMFGGWKLVQEKPRA
jgi:hypothetical protein